MIYSTVYFEAFLRGLMSINALDYLLLGLCTHVSSTKKALCHELW